MISGGLFTVLFFVCWIDLGDQSIETSAVIALIVGVVYVALTLVVSRMMR